MDTGSVNINMAATHTTETTQCATNSSSLNKIRLRGISTSPLLCSISQLVPFLKAWRTCNIFPQSSGFLQFLILIYTFHRFSSSDFVCCLTKGTNVDINHLERCYCGCEPYEVTLTRSQKFLKTSGLKAITDLIDWQEINQQQFL